MRTMTTEEAMATQIEAAERVQRARADLDAALRWAAAVAPDAPLAVKARDTERVRRADAQLVAALAAYEAAQDLECLEA